jgi:deoxyribonuclease II
VTGPMCSRVPTVCLAFAVACLTYHVGWVGPAQAAGTNAPVPLLKKGNSVDWWFAFKFNGKEFPGCAGGARRKCVFGGTIQRYKSFSQQFIYATRSSNLATATAAACLGDTVADPVGATFDQVFNGNYFYVIWNDQFYDDPKLVPCRAKGFCEAPWGHSKGILAWNSAGNGFVMQVTTPNWPGAGSRAFPRQRNGNTLGCLTRDGVVPQDDIRLIQHFFAVTLNKDDVLKVLRALQNADVVTHCNHSDSQCKEDSASGNRRQIVNNGGPPEIAQLVDKLGLPFVGTKFTREQLSTPDVELISKPSGLVVPPWQMVSAVMGGADLKVATFYSKNKIPDTNGQVTPECWDPSLARPGAVTNVPTGHWKSTSFPMFGGDNHAKIGVPVTGDFAVLGDMNQDGSLSAPCNVGQNERGGLFFVVKNKPLADSLRSLLSGGMN